jgi:hypothetical protein
MSEPFEWGMDLARDEQVRLAAFYAAVPEIEHGGIVDELEAHRLLYTALSPEQEAMRAKIARWHEEGLC